MNSSLQKEHLPGTPEEITVKAYIGLICQRKNTNQPTKSIYGGSEPLQRKIKMMKVRYVETTDAIKRSKEIRENDITLLNDKMITSKSNKNAYTERLPAAYFCPQPATIACLDGGGSTDCRNAGIVWDAAGFIG